MPITSRYFKGIPVDAEVEGPGWLDRKNDFAGYGQEGMDAKPDTIAAGEQHECLWDSGQEDDGWEYGDVCRCCGVTRRRLG